MQALLKLCSLWWLILVSAVAAEDIKFSVVGSAQRRGDIDFSIQRAPAPSKVVEDAGEGIRFSVIADVPAPPQPAIPTLSKAELRRFNRVLVFHTSKSWVEEKIVTKSVKVCPGFGLPCRIEQRQVLERVERSPQDSLQFLQGLQRLKEQGYWKCSSEEDAHFVPVDVDDPKNQALVKEFRIEKKDLPLLVKEIDPKVRRSAVGVSPMNAAEWWNDQFRDKPPQSPEPKKASSASHQEPSWGKDDDHQWTFVGPSLRAHLMDPKYPHHLPKAVVDSWTDEQCRAWHNWHHEVLSGRKPVGKPTSQIKPVQSVRHTEVVYGIARPPPPPAAIRNDPRKYEQWKAQQRARIRQQVHQQQISKMDPFTLWTIFSIVFRICSILFDIWGLN